MNGASVGGARPAPQLRIDQDRSRWDQLLIGRGLAALERAHALESERGPYQLQAEIAACHARARAADATDWDLIVEIYDALAERMPSPVVKRNRAVAVGMAQGPAAALPLVDALLNEAPMQRYHLLYAVRSDLLAKLGRNDEARHEFERAAAMTGNAREHELMQQRARVIRSTCCVVSAHAGLLRGNRIHDPSAACPTGVNSSARSPGWRLSQPRARKWSSNALASLPAMWSRRSDQSRQP